MPDTQCIRRYRARTVVKYSMTLSNSVGDVSAIVESVPLQFGGGFIELAILFLILAVVAAVLGASGIAGLSVEIAKWLVIIFVVLAIISFVL